MGRKRVSMGTNSGGNKFMAAKKNGGWVRWVVILLIAGAVVAAGVWYFQHGKNDAPQYQSIAVARGDLTQAVTATGTLNPVLNVTVGSQVSGRISKLNADFNSPVQKGEVIAELDPATYQATVEQAAADLANARANLELQQVQYNRSSELYTNKLISGSDYDIAHATLDEAAATVKIKQASLNNALVNLGYCKILSPVDGTVISRNVDIGQTVAASLSAPTIFIIANDLSKMQIDANVSEADIGSIEDSQNVSFTVDAFPDRKFTGTVKQIRNSPTTVQNVVTYDVVIEVGNPDLKLRPGMTANASIITAERLGTLKIPNAALRFRPPETPTNTTFFARLFGGGEIKTPATNAAPAAMPDKTNKTEVAANGETPLTGNEPPDELQKRVAEMRAQGEEVPPEIGAKLREYYQNGVLQRPNGGAGARGGGAGGRRAAGGTGGAGSRGAPRTVYILADGKNSGDPALQAVRVRTGISDGTYTEITDGLKEGDIVIIGVKLSQSSAASPVSGGGASPFGGGGGRGGGRGF
jgi:HlyD family secretion protein